MDVDEEILLEKNGHSNLLVSFGGIKQGLGMPVFEFYKSLNNIECDKCFIRDYNQAWYQKGVGSNLSSIQQISDYLNELITNGNYSKVCFVGNSMGGFAAILFGVTLNVDEILAFSPQSFIDKWRRFIYKDKRWAKEIYRIHEYRSSNKSVYNLKHFMKQQKSFTGKINIYYSGNDKLDKIHANRLKRFQSVSLFSRDFGGHNMVKHLKKTGELDKILIQLFS